MWKVRLSDTARRQLKKLDKQTQRDIFHYLKKSIETKEDPNDSEPLYDALWLAFGNIELAIID
jgi:mRNA-degrading endonuclease RelE of RelBE toxin-antitoxin system